MPDRMTSDELSGALKIQIQSSTGFLGGQVTEDRRRAMDHYLGEPLGNEIDGRSQIVSTDVQDVIETAMPDLMQIFGASDKTVRYEPVGREDEEYADQASDYANYIWNVDNDGFAILHDWIKDSLLQINGIVKIWWEDRERIEVDERTGQTEDDILRLMQSDDEVEILERDERWAPEAVDAIKQLGFDPDKLEPDDAAEAGIPQELIETALVYDIRFKRTIKEGRIRVANVPPEEFLVSRRAVDLADAPFTAHWTHRTVSDLVEDGYDPEQLKKIPSSDDVSFNEERITRFNREDEWPDFEKDPSPSEREIRVYECYMKVDYDGDGVGEMRKITVAGPGYEILKLKDGGEDNVEVLDHPFCSMTPIRMPHKFFGRSLAELVEDLQLIKTSLWRQLLDNAYNVTNARAAVSNRVSLDDFLNNRVGAPIRVDGETVAGQIEWQSTPPIGQHLYPAIEYVDTVRELRTGITRMGQGLDPDALNSTARGMNMLLGRTQQRLLLIAQVLALGVKDAFRKILHLMIAHQQKARTIRLRNEWVDVDPRAWNAEMDVSVNVGLGKGTMDQQMGTMSMLIQMAEKVIAYQGGISGPFIFPHHLSNMFEKWCEAAGLKSSEPYFMEIPEQKSKEIAQQAAQKPDPEQQKVEAENALKQKEMELEHKRKWTEMMLDHQRRMFEMGADITADSMERQIKAAQATADTMLKRDQAIVDNEVKRETAFMNAETAREKAHMDADVKRETGRLQAQNKPNGQG